MAVIIKLKAKVMEVVNIAIELKRDIYEELLRWKNNDSGLVLEVEGARQVGKSGEDFLNCYQVIYSWEVGQQRTEGAMHEVIKAYKHDFEDRKTTIVVIDEIQESSAIYSCIREFARDFTCDFIVTGSYLGKTREKNFFLSAGDTDNLVLGTLSFGEFMDAMGKRETYNRLSMYGESAHNDYDEIKKYFDVYCLIGGYPKVVQTYLETGDVAACRKVLDKIINIFIKESSRCFDSAIEMGIFEQLFQAIAIMLIKEKKGTEDVHSFLNALNKVSKKTGKSALPRRKKENLKEEINANLSFSIEEIYFMFHSLDNQDIISKYNLKELQAMYYAIYQRFPTSSYTKTRITNTIRSHIYSSDRAEGFNMLEKERSIQE